jgi:hypothetical protein
MPLVLLCAVAALFGVQHVSHAQGTEGREARARGASGTWSIVLATFRGPDQAALAEAGVKRVRDEAKIADVFAEVRGPATVVAVGRFADPSSPDAVARLAAVRETRVGGGRPFLSAFFAPPGDVVNIGSRPEYNLLAARQQYGERAQYSLQVAVYGREDVTRGAQGRDPTEAELAELRKAAEDAAAKLRQEGELAFYFHGPRRSMVTIGVWSDDDLPRRGTQGDDMNPPTPAREENPELSDLRRRFPHNLYNGALVRERVRPRDENRPGSGPVVSERVQPSALVKIPER